VLVWSSRTERTDGGFRTTIDVRPQGLPGPVPLRLATATATGNDALYVVIGPEGGSWTMPTSQKPRRVTLNDDRGLLARVEQVAHVPAPPQ
jgi:hypothetical protein